eukprot:scaffold2515_cov206-Skeletonema_marinoi.AAC.4
MALSCRPRRVSPLDMPDLCDGCCAKMAVEHALHCKVGGLVHCRHNDSIEQRKGVPKRLLELCASNFLCVSIVVSHRCKTRRCRLKKSAITPLPKKQKATQDGSRTSTYSNDKRGNTVVQLYHP